MEEKISSAYREFRIGAYRNKYEKALLFGGKTFTYGALLLRAEYAFNTFRQMGIEEGEKVCLWLPDCPDLLASFYGLSRLGAVGVLIHYQSTPRAVKNVMEECGAKVLLTTAGRYDLYCRLQEELPQTGLVLCRPELDMKRAVREEYQRMEWEENTKAERPVLDRMMQENQYSSLETPAGDLAREAVLLCGASSFRQARLISYLPEELAEISARFWQGKEQVQTVYIENSFATEGGFLAAHSALCAGKTILWAVGSALPLIRKKRPHFLVATEEFFWAMRQDPKRFGRRYKKLRGGYQIGQPIRGVMEKYASRVMAGWKSAGRLEGCPVPLKSAEQPLVFRRDFGVCLADMEAEFSRLPGIVSCKVLEENGAICLQILPGGDLSAGELGKSIAACCRWEMNDFHLPQKVEFRTNL